MSDMTVCDIKTTYMSDELIYMSYKWDSLYPERVMDSKRNHPSNAPFKNRTNGCRAVNASVTFFTRF